MLVLCLPAVAYVEMDPHRSICIRKASSAIGKGLDELENRLKMRFKTLGLLQAVGDSGLHLRICQGLIETAHTRLSSASE